MFRDRSHPFSFFIVCEKGSGAGSVIEHASGNASASNYACREIGAGTSRLRGTVVRDDLRIVGDGKPDSRTPDNLGVGWRVQTVYCEYDLYSRGVFRRGPRDS